MKQLTMQRTMDAPAELVWEVISDPDLYADVAPNLTSIEILEGEGEGMVRRCTDTKGNTWTEECHLWEEGRRYGVAVHTDNSPVHRRLFKSFRGEWGLQEHPEGVLVTMWFEYDPKYGPLGAALGKLGEPEGRKLMRQIFDGWEVELAQRLGESVEAVKSGGETNELHR